MLDPGPKNLLVRRQPEGSLESPLQRPTIRMDVFYHIADGNIVVGVFMNERDRLVNHWGVGGGESRRPTHNNCARWSSPAGTVWEIYRFPGGKDD